MRFYSFFARFWVNYRVFWSGCLHFFSVDFWYIRWQIINVYKISIFITFGYGTKRKTDRQP